MSSSISRRDVVTGAGLAAAAAALQASSADAQRPSADDLVRAVKAARVYDLSFTWNEQAPLLGLNPPFGFALNRTHRMTHEMFGQAPGSQVSWASEIMYFSGQHGAPTIDALGHIGRDLKLHGGVDATAASGTPGGIGMNLGIDHFPLDLMLSRCVLLDVARQVAGGRPDPLPPGFEITGRHLDDTARAQGVEVRRGDALMIRTGWGQHFATKNGVYLGEQSPGPGQDGARWIMGKGARLAGNDTATFEKRPPVYGRELFSVHMMLLVDSGIYIVENTNLEEVGAANAHVFLLVVTPLKIQGASGSPLRALAVAPA
jgi:kynurenine formamidase